MSAVCHGPAGLIGATTGQQDEQPLVQGKRVTAFSDREEEMLGLASKIPFSLERKLADMGGQFTSGPPWSNHVEIDGRLITGQNPASSVSVARGVLDTLQATG